MSLAGLVLLFAGSAEIPRPYGGRRERKQDCAVCTMTKGGSLGNNQLWCPRAVAIGLDGRWTVESHRVHDVRGADLHG